MVGNVLTPEHKTLVYEYDFRLGYEVHLFFEGRFKATEGLNYPTCLAGQGKSPAVSTLPAAPLPRRSVPTHCLGSLPLRLASTLCPTLCPSPLPLLAASLCLYSLPVALIA